MNKALIRIAGGAAIIFSSLVFTGCETTSNDARYVDTQGTETIVSLNQINIQDWINASDQMVASLLESGVLERSARQPAVLSISRISNDTQQRVDTDALVKNIRVALNKTGKVVTTTTMGIGGRVEDPLAKSASDMEAFMNDEAQKVIVPDYSLSGKLLEDRVSVGKNRQVTYTFQLSLTEVKTGLAVWEDVVNITKAGTRPSVGW